MVRTLVTLATLATLLATAVAADDASNAPSRGRSDGRDTSPVQGRRIDKVYFLFHPVCWQMAGEKAPPGVDPENWAACFGRELRVNEEQKKLISRMEPNEALVLFPIGTSPAMRELEEHASKTLGERCIIVRRGGKDPPREWASLERPFDRLLDDPDLQGRAEFLSEVPGDIQDELAAEIREARKGQTVKWNTAVLEVLYYSRLCAMDILHEFQKRDLVIDPATVRSEAFGEGFEQCAMTWKQMLVPYLGFAHPAENVFELSVSGAPFLAEAKLVERIALSGDVRLFLWETNDGRKIAVYARAWCRLKDPQLNAYVPLADLNLDVRECHDKRCWPEADGKELQLSAEDGFLKLPVFNGIRRDSDWRATVGTDEEACYLIASDVSIEQFRGRLATVRIEESKAR